jgi:IclR family acetate operon transcriptional repressor
VTKETNSVQSIERAFNILELLRDQRQEMGVREIAEQVNLNVATVHRLLQTLITVRAVRQNPRTRQYTLAPTMLLYGKSVVDKFDFVRSAHPFLGELSKAVGETAFMGILDEFDLVYIDHVDTLDHTLRITPQIGRRQHAHCTSLGKVLLAHLPPSSLNVFLNQPSFPKLTEFSIDTPQGLRETLSVIRMQGYAVDNEEAEIGICCVAAPVIGLQGDVIAAISVSGPASRIRAKGVDTFLRENVVKTARDINMSFFS